jgi:hypothetical protein
MPPATNVPAASGLGNRRAHRRAELRSRVALCSEFGPLSATAFDVSPIGLGVETEVPLAPGVFVSVAFTLPSGAVIDVQAQVARSSSRALGLKFYGLRQEERRELAAYCDSWRRELLERCSQRTGFDRTPVAVVAVAKSTSRDAEISQAVASAPSSASVCVSRIIAVTGD